MFSTVWQDAAYALRSLTKSPAFTAVAVLSLALGIGLNGTIFTVVDTLLFRPLPVRAPETLAAVYTSAEEGEGLATTSFPDFVDLRARNSVFTDLVGHTLMFASARFNGQNRLTLGEVVTANYFSALGVVPALGRGFLAEEEVGEGAHPVTVLSDRLWRREFGARQDVLGQTLVLKDRPFTIVGVAPATFTGLTPGLSAELWVPVSMVDSVEPAGMNDVVPSATGSTRLGRRGTRWLFVKGRMKDGVTVDAARANLEALMRDLEAEHPMSNRKRRAGVMPAASVRFHPAIDASLEPAGALMMGAVGLVLLVACANLANMLLARGAARRRELAIRTALGASRARLVWQLLVESLILALLAGAAGVLLARWATSALGAYQLPVELPIAFALTFDARTLLFTLGLALASGLVFGLVPALRASTAAVVPALRDDASLSSPGRRFSLRHALVTAQVAVSLVLIVGGLLLWRSLGAALVINPGFAAGELAVATVALDFHGYDRTRGLLFFAEGADRLRRLPGVSAVAISERVPFSLNVQTTSILIDGRPEATPESGASIDVARVSADYFRAMGVAMVEGRAFDARETETSPGTAIVSQAFAKQYFPGESAVGRRVRRGRTGDAFEIVGVSANYSVRAVGETPRPVIHFSREQQYSASASFVVRASGDLARTTSLVERELRALEPDLVFTEIAPVDRLIAVSLQPVSIGATLIGALAGLALLLAGIGLYGVIAFSVARRTREIGIRMALGSTRGRVIRHVLREGLGLVAIGGLVGLLLAAAGSRALASVLYVAPSDPISYVAAALFIAGTAVVASVVPARRAASVDPLQALKS